MYPKLHVKTRTCGRHFMLRKVNFQGLFTKSLMCTCPTRLSQTIQCEIAVLPSIPVCSKNLQHHRVKLQCAHLHLCIQKLQHHSVDLQHTNFLRIIWTTALACPELNNRRVPEDTAAVPSRQNIPVYSCIFAHCVFTYVVSLRHNYITQLYPMNL